MATIVPIDVDPAQFKGRLYKVLAEHDAVEAWPVSLWVREEAAKRTLSLLDAGKHKELPEGPGFRLNFGKLSDQLVRGLLDRGIEVQTRGSDVEVEYRVGVLVMCTLAHYLGDQTESRPVTDDPALGEAYVSVLSASRRAETIGAIIRRDLEIAVPEVRDIELAQWLAFRSQHQRELGEYRSSLEGLAREVAGAETMLEVDAVLDRRKEDLEKAVHRGFWRKLTSERSVSTLSLVVGLPSMAIDPGLGLSFVAGAFGAGVTITQLLKRRVHALTFVQRVHRKFS